MTRTDEPQCPGSVDPCPQPAPEPWRRRFVPHFLRREKIAGQVVRFGMVGVLNTIVDFAIFNLLFHVVGLPLLVSNTLSVSAGITNSFLWNKHWTFSAGGWSRWKHEAFVFLVISVIGLLINNLGILVLTTITGDTGVVAVNLQKLAASVLSMTWNFLGYRLVAFRHRHSEGA